MEQKRIEIGISFHRQTSSRMKSTEQERNRVKEREREKNPNKYQDKELSNGIIMVFFSLCVAILAFT